MRVILYIRASTDDQQITLEAQRAKLLAYAALYDLVVIDCVVESESAKSLNRPGLQGALASLKAGDADGIVVAKLDRLTRNVADWQWLIDNYFGERAGKQLFSVQDSIDTRTASGRMVLNIILVIAQWERETIAERTKEALAHKLRRGERCGKVKFGYDLAPDGKTLVPNQGEQAALALIVEWRRAGYTLRGIAAELDAMGIKAKGGKPWSMGSVARILARAA